jgi:putative DNA methylase
MAAKKKLIEVALPLEAINKASVRENFIYRGNPTALHKWWAQRPLAAARAVIFAQMVDDPSSHADVFRTEKAQEEERQRLFQIMEDLVIWENGNNEEVLDRARAEIWQNWRATCEDNSSDPDATDLFDLHRLPPFCDPFAGSGSLPLEAQRLGLESHASDLNPVAVLINKMLVEVPSIFSGFAPVHLQAGTKNQLITHIGHGTEGLAEDVLHYGRWIRDQAEKRVGGLYPKVEITTEIAEARPELKSLVGKKLRVIAWLWARTVLSPNPAFANIEVPLAATFMLSTKAGKEVYVEPIIQRDTYRFLVRSGKPLDDVRAKSGTKLARGASFRCVMSGTPISADYIYAEAKAGRMGARLMALALESERGRIYVSPTCEQESLSLGGNSRFKPDVVMPDNPRSFSPPLYGLQSFGDIFTVRQLEALTTLSDLVQEVRELVKRDAVAAGLTAEDPGLAEGGRGANGYADAVVTLLAFAVDKTVEYGCTLVPWYAKENRPKGIFARQAIPMVWDYAEVNPLSEIGGSFHASVKIVSGALAGCYALGKKAIVSQRDAISPEMTKRAVISTDPPYYDNVPYADLSDFFYVWLRRSLKAIYPELFATVSVPKSDELVAIPYRHGGKRQAESFFLTGMTKVMHRLAEQCHPAFPVTIYYAFRQSETESGAGTTSTGWETFLDAVLQAGFSISGTWPIRTERGARSVARDSNALASSIVLVCRPRESDAVTATRRDFISALKAELPLALMQLQHGNIAPVDLAQAAIGPGMAVYTRYAKVLDAEGRSLSVNQALALINETLDEVLTEQEGDFDAESRWAVTWFEQSGFAEGDYGVAEQLSKSKVTDVAKMAQAGILSSRGGRVRLFKPQELPADWDPDTDPRLTTWEIVHRLIRSLETGGEGAAAALVAKLGAKAEVARELAYRLYTVSERKKRAAEALSYNGLVQSWPEITRLAREETTVRPTQPQLI